MMSDDWMLIGRQENTSLGGIVERLRQPRRIHAGKPYTNSVEAGERFGLSAEEVLEYCKPD